MFILLMVVPVAIISFVAAALIRSNTLCIIASALAAELLFVLYSVLRVAQAHALDIRVLHGVSITVVFGTPLFVGLATGFTFLARWMYKKRAT